MSYWMPNGSILRARDNREPEGNPREEMTDEDRALKERQLQNRRLGSTIAGKNTYNKKKKTRKW